MPAPVRIRAQRVRAFGGKQGTIDFGAIFDASLAGPAKRPYSDSKCAFRPGGFTEGHPELDIWSNF
jgi:hypothetical protein